MCEPLGRSEGRVVAVSRGRLRNMGIGRKLWRPCWRSARRPKWAASGAVAAQERKWLPIPYHRSEHSLVWARPQSPIRCGVRNGAELSQCGRRKEWGPKPRSERERGGSDAQECAGDHREHRPAWADASCAKQGPSGAPSGPLHLDSGRIVAARRRISDMEDAQTNAWRDRITVDPQVCHGQACIAGTRVLVTVLLDNLAAGRTPEQVAADYPALSIEDVRAAISYAAELAHERTVPLSSA